MPVIAREAGATVIEINPESTPFTNGTSDYFIQGEAGQIMQEIVAEIKRL
jgi:NAD-dependent deacetylase